MDIDDLAEETPPRPAAISIVSVLMLGAVIMTIPLLFTDSPARVGPWYPPVLGMGAVVGFLCAIGFWKMQKWAVFTYAAFFVVNQVILFVMGVWNVFAFLLPIVVIGVAFRYLSKMT